jgi:hypothetical protein
MLLSVVVYNHTLSLGQWLGAAIVFAGISVEAFVKRKGALPCALLTFAHICTRCPCKTCNPRKGKGKDQIFIMDHP